jgi:hypothetical protein
LNARTPTTCSRSSSLARRQMRFSSEPPSGPRAPRHRRFRLPAGADGRRGSRSPSQRNTSTRPSRIRGRTNGPGEAERASRCFHSVDHEEGPASVAVRQGECFVQVAEVGRSLAGASWQGLARGAWGDYGTSRWQTCTPSGSTIRREASGKRCPAIFFGRHRLGAMRGQDPSTHPRHRQGSNHVVVLVVLDRSTRSPGSHQRRRLHGHEEPGGRKDLRRVTTGD